MAAAIEEIELEPGEILEPEEPINGSLTNFIEKLNPTKIIYMDENGCELTRNKGFLQASLMGVVCKNPLQYSEEENEGISNKQVTQETFNRVAKIIRESQQTICSGQINSPFFSEVEKRTDVFFLLYSLVIPQREKKTKRALRMIGFVCCNDLSQYDLYEEDTEKHENIEECDEEETEGEGGKTLYIESICAKMQKRSGEKSVSNEPKNIGKLLLYMVEQYALINKFAQIKLSALGYVINYYRRFGYKHDCGCNSVELDEIKIASEKARNTVFKSEQIANLTYYVEKAIKLIDRSRDPYIEFTNSMKKYLENDELEYEDVEGETHEETTNNILSMLPKPKNKEKLTTSMIENEENIDYFGYYELIRLLVKNKFSVSCNMGKKSERIILKDEDGENIDCLDDGFTMRKCIIGNGENLIKIACENGSTGGKKKKKTKKGKSNKKRKKTKKQKK